MNRGLIEAQADSLTITSAVRLPRFMNRGLIEALAISVASPSHKPDFPDS